MTSTAGPDRTVRPLRVAQFIDSYGPGNNGLTVAVQQLEGSLLDAGHEVVLVAPRASGPNPHAGRPGRHEIRLPSVMVPGLPTRVATGRHFDRTLAALAAARPAVVHVHGLGPVGILGMWASRRLGIPLLVTWHTDFDAYARHYSSVLLLLGGMARAWAHLRPRAPLDPALLRAAAVRREDRGWPTASLLGVCEQILESADLVTAPSPKTAGRCRELCPDVQVVVVPSGVDPLPPGPPRLPRGSGPLILYAGRVSPEKGIGLLVAAFERVLERRPDARLMVVGDWTRFPGIRRLLSQGQANGTILLPGEQRRADLGAFYAMADVFAFPSQTDTQALVLHEAALAGLPIVSVDPDLRLVLEPGVNGELAVPTPQGLATALLRVIDRLPDEGWRTSAAETSRRLASRWSVDSQSAEMLRLYAALAAREPAPV